MKKLIRFLAMLAKLLGLVTVLDKVPFIPPQWGIPIFLLASLGKDFLVTLCDWLDDGKINKSFDPQRPLPGIGLVLALLLTLAMVGCARYSTNPDGSQSLTLFMQKAAFEGLKVSPKTGLSVKVAETQGDVDLARAIAEGAAAGAARGAAKTVVPFLP